MRSCGENGQAHHLRGGVEARFGHCAHQSRPRKGLLCHEVSDPGGTTCAAVPHGRRGGSTPLKTALACANGPFGEVAPRNFPCRAAEASVAGLRTVLRRSPGLQPCLGRGSHRHAVRCQTARRWATTVPALPRRPPAGGSTTMSGPLPAQVRRQGPRPYEFQALPAARRPSAVLAESRSTTSSPIFACSSWVSAYAVRFPPLATHRSKNPASLSLALRFHWLTWFGYTSCRAVIRCTVRSSPQRVQHHPCLETIREPPPSGHPVYSTPKMDGLLA